MNTPNPTNEALLSERVQALEKQCEVLAAEVDRQNLLVSNLHKWKQRVYGLSREPWPYEQDLLAAINTYEASAPK